MGGSELELYPQNEILVPFSNLLKNFRGDCSESPLTSWYLKIIFCVGSSQLFNPCKLSFAITGNPQKQQLFFCSFTGRSVVWSLFAA